jgi:hypothetical protein
MKKREEWEESKKNGADVSLIIAFLLKLFWMGCYL